MREKVMISTRGIRKIGRGTIAGIIVRSIIMVIIGIIVGIAMDVTFLIM
jgi:hypothetical protein